MALFSHDCPYCGTPKAAFDVVSEFRSLRYSDEIYAFLRCNICTRGTVVVAKPRGRNVASDVLSFGEYQQFPEDFRIIGFYPTPQTPDAPEHLPTNVRQFFIEAVQNVKTGPNAAGAMFRKTLDVSMKIIDPEAKGLLVNRIDAAEEKGLLTKDLAEWSHHLRLDGNDASHDEDPFTREEAAEMHQFTELVMLYLFTLPGMLKARWSGDVEEQDAEKGS